MSDNAVLNPGAGGITAATDDIGGVHWQRIKLTLGDDGVNAGDVSELNPMPVKSPELEALETLNDTILVLLSAVLEKMPRVTGNDQMAVSVESHPSFALTANQDLRNITGAVANITSIGSKTAATSVDALNMAGTAHIYNNIIVS